jgi:hypothetical protein
MTSKLGRQKKKRGINKTRTTKQAEDKIKHEKKRRKAKLARRRHEGNTHLLLHKMESRSKSLADIHQERSSMIQQLRKQRMLGLRLSDSSSYKKEEQREKN